MARCRLCNGIVPFGMDVCISCKYHKRASKPTSPKKEYSKEELQSKVEALERRVKTLEPTTGGSLGELLKTLGALIYIIGFSLLCYVIATAMGWI